MKRKNKSIKNIEKKLAKLLELRKNNCGPLKVKDFKISEYKLAEKLIIL